MAVTFEPGTGLREVATMIVAELQRRGFTTYFAGGCVRDALRGLSPKDIDIATSATPGQIQRFFRKTVPVGAQFGVIRVLEQQYEFEVATFRSDGIYFDGRRPESVTFSSAEEDARRRDFTINGMFYDPVADKVIDYVGGRLDLERGLIRAIGDPQIRFNEDRLRLLRAVRFAATLEFEIEERTWIALKRHAAEILLVSPERIRDELVKILSNRNRLRGFDLLDTSGLFGAVLPEVARLKGCQQPLQFHPEGDVFRHTRKMLGLLEPDAPISLVLSVLLHDIGKPPTQSIDPQDNRIRFNGHDRVGAEMAEEVLTRLRFSRDDIDAVVEPVRNHMVFKDVKEMRPARLRRFMARETFPIELELHRVDCASSHGDLENYDFLRDKATEFAAEPIIPPPLLTGDDLIGLGMTPGPRFGELLEAVQTAQLEGEITTKEEALRLVQKLEERKL
ncbi:MAG: CCA tRNA nucleotidyltransferase [Chthoniobacterales bacterium]